MRSLMENYLRTHYGYGNPHANFWFIGMEEGGGGSREEIQRRIEIWQEMGAREVTDVVEFHHRLNFPEFFRDPVKLQRTWAQLIRIVLGADGLATDAAAVKAYQRDNLGRLDGDTCLLELLPLPSPNTGVWNYGEWTGLPYLKDRETYRQSCIPWRAAHLRAMIEQYRPKAVVFYGITYRPYYEQVAGSLFAAESGGAAYAQNENTLFALVKHPAAWGDGANSAYFERVGREIREKLAGTQELPDADHTDQPLDVEPYGLYRCGKCGKMLMGFDFPSHITHDHKGQNHGCMRIR